MTRIAMQIMQLIERLDSAQDMSLEEIVDELRPIAQEALDKPTRSLPPRRTVHYPELTRHLYTPGQLANELGVSDRTIRRWLSDGRFGAVADLKGPGGRWRVPAHAVAAFLGVRGPNEARLEVEHPADPEPTLEVDPSVADHSDRSAYGIRRWESVVDDAA